MISYGSVSISSFDDKALLTFEIDKYYFHYANRIQRSQNIGKVKNSILTSVKDAIFANTLNENYFMTIMAPFRCSK